jgi:hypothetical protein
MMLIGVTRTEEHLLVGSLCDLLELTFTHRLQARHWKSAVWTFSSSIFAHHYDCSVVDRCDGN